MTPFFATLLVSAAVILRSVTGQAISMDYREPLVDVLSICEAEIPSCTLLPQTVQAPCLYAADGQIIIATTTPTATAQISVSESGVTNTRLYDIASSVTPSAGSKPTTGSSRVVTVMTISPSSTSATKMVEAPRSAPGNVDFLSVLLTLSAMAVAEVFICKLGHD
ncbi:hypothetical protein EDD36DRAFT_244683 [Exophiala viscosa]|uniref:Uncharacterized protein n=1 Tax=Exophiala viscosa TaxID=2486360 RepID=A0AAN6DW82_9EURO|nr:hypothetical protein EDD36DRAFT_244683 [Exophiala viscosa]